MANNVPNLDAMPDSELMEFWKRYHRASRKDAAELIGDTRMGYIKLSAKLANYACNKAVAMQCRVRGDIPAAALYEDIAERIYRELPEDLRW